MIRIAITLVFTFMSLVMYSQTMKEIFATLPDSILPSLTKNDRLDCIDFIENNMTTEVNNALKGKTRLTVLTDNLAKIQVSPLTEMQICKLATANGYIICLVHSSNVGGWDSTIRFYDSTWKLLDTSKFIDLPTTSDYIPQPADMDASAYSNIINLADFPLIQADFDNTTLSLIYTSSNSNDEKYKTTVLPLVQPVIKFNWNAADMHFVRE